MTTKQILLFFFLVVTIPTIGGCAVEKKGNKFPFDEKEHTEEYILTKLKQNYGIDFSYSHEWEGVPYENEFSVYTDSVDNSKLPELLKPFIGNQTETYFTAVVEPADKKQNGNQAYAKYGVSADSHGTITDCCHAYFFRDQITGALLSLIGTSVSVRPPPFIRIVGLERPLGTWKGTESLKSYIKAQDFESYVYIYLPADKSDGEYAETIQTILRTLYTEEVNQYNITLEVRLNDYTTAFENKTGSIIFYQDLDQFDMGIDHWTEEMILEHIDSDKLLNDVKPEDVYQ